MLDIVLAGVTGLVLAVLLSQPARPPAPDQQPEEPAAAPKASTSGSGAKRAKSKWD
jgi:hypothetical protein